ncbi:MAG: DUF3365 domain-containing protein [Gammaproteobacteria bacterium]|jgi:hypothetical protein|nr:DUF3365 domain-containing protein [Gammaproteobacteria bacterium]
MIRQSEPKTTRRSPISAAACLAVALASAHTAAWSAESGLSAQDPLERAKAAAQAFSGQLRGKLQAAMGEGGPVLAVGVCRTEAPAIAEAVMREHGVRLGRVAMPGRNRNPNQAADGWQLQALKDIQKAVDEGAPAAEQVRIYRDDLPADVALRMMRGIATEPVCTSCHGVDMTPEIRDAIARHYPDDGATGFAVGDLRGALWVEVPAN